MATARMGAVIRDLRRTVLLRNDAGRTDGELLTAFLRRDDEAAFAGLLHRHGPMVLGVCRRVVRNHHDAEDAFQATFLLLACKAASVRPREMVGNWLHGVAFRTALKARARTAKRQARERQLPRLPEPAAPPAAPVQELQPLLDQELRGLPEIYRLPLLLCDLEGQTLKGAAAQLGWPLGTVAGRLARGRKLLAGRLARRGVALGGVAPAVLFAPAGAAAAVPSALLSATFEMATLMSVGQAAVPVQVAPLMQGVLTSMTLTRCTVVLATALLALCLAGLGGAAGGRGQDKPPPQKQTEPDRVAHLIRQLGDPKFQKREAAGKQLQALGEPALDALHAAASSVDGEVRLRATRLHAAITAKLLATPLRTIKTDGLPLHAVAISPDEKLLAVGGGWERVPGGWQYTADRDVRLFELATGKEVHRFKGPTDNAVGQLAFSPDGTCVGVGGDDWNLHLWEVKTGKLRYALGGHTYAFGYAFAPDGKRLLTASWDHSVRLWNMATGLEAERFAPGGRVDWGTAAFLPGGKKAVVGGLGRLALLNLETGAVERWFPWGRGRVGHVTLSPDGTRLLTTARDGTDGRVRLWDVASGRLIRVFDNLPAGDAVAIPHCLPGIALHAVWLRDGQHFVTAEGNAVCLRRADTGAVLHTYKNHADCVMSVAVSSSGRYVVGAGVDEKATVWRLPRLSPPK